MHLQQSRVVQVCHHLFIPVTKHLLIIHLILLNHSLIESLQMLLIFSHYRLITKNLNVMHDAIIWLRWRTEKLRIRFKLNLRWVALLTILHWPSFDVSWRVELWFSFFQMTISSIDHFSVVSYYHEGFLWTLFFHFIANLFL